MMEYSEGSSSKVNLPVSLGEVQKETIARGDKTMENFNVGVQLEDLTIGLDDISDKSTETWKIGLEFLKMRTQSSQALIVV
jgi:fructose-bisphosphate aldolase class 1